MASANFGSRGKTIVGILLKAEDEGLNEIRGGIYEFRVSIPLVWESNLARLKTTNSIKTNNAMIFPHPATYPIENISLTNSSDITKSLQLVLQTGTIQSDTFKFIREIVIKLGE